MGVLHVYESGRKAYDMALHALSVLEQLDYLIVSRGQDTDTGQNKPLRIWLTENFFTSRGIQVDEIRQWLAQYRLWAIKNGLTESLRKKYERHLVRIAHEKDPPLGGESRSAKPQTQRGTGDSSPLLRIQLSASCI
ncbi:replication protein [Serratia marcescens VGH107]|nr:replication protein [Serratia marcescens VGH107]